VKFSGQLKDASGTPLTNVVGITFAIYSEQSGGLPLWQETQNVQFSNGRYTVFLGSNTSTGIPLEFFASGQSRWLGVTALLPGEEEQPRVVLASVPYALKAVDADTLGGLPPSSYLRADSVSGLTSPSVAVNSNKNGALSPSLGASGGTPGSAISTLGVPTTSVSTNSGGNTRGTTTNGGENGRISITDSTTASYRFVTKWSSPPVCSLTPTSDPHELGGYWVTSSTSTITANVHNPGLVTFNFHCHVATNF
jgi:hypothetical protein